MSEQNQKRVLGWVDIDEHDGHGWDVLVRKCMCVHTHAYTDTMYALHKKCN